MSDTAGSEDQPAATARYGIEDAQKKAALPTPPQLTALWIISMISLAIALLLALIGANIDPTEISFFGGDGINDTELAWKVGLAAISNFLFVLSAMCFVGGLVLGGVRELLSGPTGAPSQPEA